MLKKTGLVFFPAFDWAISPTHPEREERLLYTRDQMFEEGLLDLPQIKEFTPELAMLHDVSRVHFCVPGPEDQVTEAHLIAAGSAISLANKILDGKIKNAFALVRPPGHHAMRVVHGNRGFCNINNEAVLVDYLRARRGVKRIAIIDSDCHHGDGTQDIFFHDPDVLFFSFHQDPRTIFPGTGFTHELGGPGAFAKTFNIPLPVGAGDKCIINVIDNLILPILEEFQPDFIINSAGQDNHFSDPLGSMRASARGYALLTEKLKPDMAVLEGGYAIESALPYINMGILMALAGIDYDNIVEPKYNEVLLRESKTTIDSVDEMIRDLRKIWKLRKSVKLDKIFGTEEFFEQKKSVFYDTDSFVEEQTERVKRCGNCSGYITIDSQASHGYLRSYNIYGITVPFGACLNCRREAYRSYETAKRSKSYRYVYMQDKPNDDYYSYRRSSNYELKTTGTGGGMSG